MEDHQSNADRYKAIFDLCDDDKDGYIDVDHFRGLAKDHFGAEGLDLEEITGVINLLDPEGRGLISYDDFCRGVEQIIDIQNQAQSSRIRSSVSVDTLVPLDIAGDLSGLHETVSPSSQSTYAEYDFAGLENLSGPSSTETPVNNSSFVDSLSGLDLLSGAPIGNDSLFVPQFNSTVLAPPIVSEDEGDSAISGRSSEINENRPEITDEENYEDFGEVESEADVSDQGLTNRRLTTAALASQLQRSSRDVTPSSTRRSSYGSDEIFDDIDGNFQDLNGRVKYLEGQLLRLTDSQLETTTKQAKLKEENSVLVNKVIYLEEQLRDMELRGEERITEERRKHQEQMARRDREKSEEQDYLTQRLHRVEGEYESLKGESSKMRTEVQKLRTEKVELQERMLEKQEMYNMLYDDNERLKAEYHKQEEMHQRERRSMGQLLDELGKELEELRKYKIEVETGVRSPSGNISELPGRYQELQGEIHKLKEAMWEEWRELLKENRGLQSSNDDLNAQLMNRCVAEGKSLLQDANAKSLAEELEQLTKEELMQQLRQEQDFSLRLKQYVDRIIITILEKNPSLLEIKSFGM
ncbi:rab11 family-interacting protein 4-like isoform X6 [Babylonia areolata]|uniref:rab11 family-interacting protein 4-like isoform X6 n=1 Tax=Babylonia areolata TaxID=304850 RepID=UPI003FD2FA2D